MRESVQFLLDANGQAGNRIVHASKTRLCRDGEGRTRQELERSGRRQVILRDPVARESWLLDAERKNARRLGQAAGILAGSGAALLDSAGWHDYAGRLRDWARSMRDQARAGAASAPRAAPPPPPAAPAAPREAELVAITRHAHDAAEHAQREANVHVLRLQSSAEARALAPPPQPGTPAAVSLTAHAFAPRGQGVVTSLGSKDIEGLRANGERTSWTIEAGKVGNEKPIQILREVWTSPDLMLTVQVRDFDPRRGESNYRLANVKRGEPDAALMKVPSDYAKPVPRGSGPAGVADASAGRVALPLRRDSCEQAAGGGQGDDGQRRRGGQAPQQRTVVIVGASSNAVPCPQLCQDRAQGRCSPGVHGSESRGRRWTDFRRWLVARHSL